MPWRERHINILYMLSCFIFLVWLSFLYIGFWSVRPFCINYWPFTIIINVNSWVAGWFRAIGGIGLSELLQLVCTHLVTVVGGQIS